GETGRKMYRRFNGAGAFRLVTTIANNTATSYTDAISNAGLGAAALATPTAIANQATISWLASGQSAITYIQIYRTPLGSTQLKFVVSVAGNAAGSYVD